MDSKEFPPFLCADLLAALRAGVHVVALQSVLDGHLVQRLLNKNKQEDTGKDKSSRKLFLLSVKMLNDIKDI